jgi:hypothetical protein
MRTIGAIFLGYGLGMMNGPKTGDAYDLFFLIPFSIAFFFISVDMYYDYKEKKRRRTKDGR